jgi:hypothetical protein
LHVREIHVSASCLSLKTRMLSEYYQLKLLFITKTRTNS